MIDALTDDQVAQFPRYVREWTARGLSCEPLDLDRAKAAVAQAYATAGLPPPGRYVVCDSPLSGAITAGILRASIKDSVLDSVRDAVWASVRASVSDSVRALVSDSVSDAVWASVWASVRASVSDSVWDAVSGSVRASIKDSVSDAVKDSVSDAVRDAVWASVRASVSDSVWASVSDAVWASVRASVCAPVSDAVTDAVWASVWDAVSDSVRDSVSGSVRDAVWASVCAPVRASVSDAVRDAVRDAIWDAVWNAVWNAVNNMAYGKHEAGWLSFYAFMRDELGLECCHKLDGLIELADCCGWWAPYRDVAILQHPHCELHRDQRGRLHNETGPAALYRDGWGVYAIHGVRVPADVVTNPESITVERIDAEANAELRRVMLERFGFERYLDARNLAPVSVDDWGKLYVVGDIGLVDVLNSTPEPDGSRRRYLLPVHPECRPLFEDGKLGEPQRPTPLNAIASTFGLTGPEYARVKVHT